MTVSALVKGVALQNPAAQDGDCAKPKKENHAGRSTPTHREVGEAILIEQVEQVGGCQQRPAFSQYVDIGEAPLRAMQNGQHRDKEH